MTHDLPARIDAPSTDHLALGALGWDEHFATGFREHAEPDQAPARVVAEHRSEYLVATAGGDRPAVLAGRLRYESTMPEALPAVGDWVAVAAPSGDGRLTIHGVLPRRTAFVRGAAGGAHAVQVVAANVDVACVVVPAPSVNARWLERFVAVAWDSGAEPLVVLTKSDLCDHPAAAVAESAAAAPGVDVVLLSAATGTGLDALEARLSPGLTLVLVGASGAGKSTLVNRLAGAERMATAAVRGDGKGRHTTTHRELVRLASGALLVDTPGMRELALWDAAAGVEAAFADVDALGAECRFGDCAHDAEPGCAVREAVATGGLDAERLAAWGKLRRELDRLAARGDPVASAEATARNRAVHRELNRFLRERGR